MSLDLWILCGYFVFMATIGFIFRKFTDTTSNYFRGGGNILWWMIGSTAFMTQFSAWTFTGAASKAYTDGLTIVAIFFGNAFAFFMNARWAAPKFRRLNVITMMEAVRIRYGKGNEQFFVWTSLPMGVLYAGVWLAGLAAFVSALTGINLTIAILGSGIVVVFIALVGGSWAVIASDFLQMLLLMAVSVVTAVYAYCYGGGMSNIIKNFPHKFITGDTLTFTSIFFLWVIAMFVKQFMNLNHLGESYRYLSAKDAHNAKKGAYLASFLMLVGPLIWFIPPWVTAGMYSNLSALYPTLGAKANDAAYLAFVQNAMPAGMAGLLMAALFAATMSSMDTGLNKNAGIFTRNVYLPLVRKYKENDKELVIVAKISTAVFGLFIILGAEFITGLKSISLFNAMQYISSLISLPILIPLLFGLAFKKVPKWAPIATVIVGGIISYIVPQINYDTLFNVTLTHREHADMIQLIGIFAHIFLTGGFFLLTSFFYKENADPAYDSIINNFFDIAHNKTLAHEKIKPVPIDNRQRRLLGTLAIVLGTGVILLILIPNPFIGRLAFLLTGGIVFAAGAALVAASKEKIAD